MYNVSEINRNIIAQLQIPENAIEVQRYFFFGKEEENFANNIKCLQRKFEWALEEIECRNRILAKRESKC